MTYIGLSLGGSERKDERPWSKSEPHSYVPCIPMHVNPEHVFPEVLSLCYISLQSTSWLRAVWFIGTVLQSSSFADSIKAGVNGKSLWQAARYSSYRVLQLPKLPSRSASKTLVRLCTFLSITVSSSLVAMAIAFSCLDLSK